MNIFITGSSGFIGKNIVENLYLNKKIKIYANSRKKIFRGKKIKIIRKSLNKIKYTDLKNIDLIIHTASVGVKNIDISINKAINFNFFESLLFFKKAIKAGCKNWIILGSSSEYGYNLLHKKKIKKNDNLDPADNYSLSKSLFYYSIFSIAKAKNINLIYLRTFPVYGQNEKSHRLIPQMKNSIKLKKKFILKNPDVLIDYSNVIDISKKIIKICKYIKNKKELRETWHLASGKHQYLQSFAFDNWTKLGGKREMFKIKNQNVNMFHHISDINSIWK